MSLSTIVRGNIRDELKRSGKSVNELAMRLGVSRQTASSKLNGHSAFTFDELDSIAKWLSLKPEAFIATNRQALAS